MSDPRAYLILGGSGAIGSAVIGALVQRGDRVLAAGRNEASLAQTAASYGAETAVVDATDVAAVRRLGKEAVSRFGRLDGVVNCVGSILLKPAHATRPAELAEVLAVNVNSAFGCVQAAVDGMRKNGGSLVLLSSAAARHGLANHDAIAAAKAAIIGLTQSAAATYAGRDIRVNAIAPGLIETPLSAALLSAPAARAASTALHPLGRLGAVADVASAILWLLDATWITGQVVGVDGGLARVRSR